MRGTCNPSWNIPEVQAKGQGQEKHGSPLCNSRDFSTGTMNVRNLGQGNKSWVWQCIATGKPQACGPCSQKLWHMKYHKTHTNSIHVKGGGSDSAINNAFIMLGNATLYPCSPTSLKDQMVSVWTMDGANCYRGSPATKHGNPAGSTKSISLPLTRSQTHANHLPCPKQTPTQVLLTG